jgi:hypothetical protein
MHQKAGLPAVAWAIGRSASAKLRRTRSSLRFALRCQAKAGAGDEARTRDVHLGKVVLYQLSYTRVLRGP